MTSIKVPSTTGIFGKLNSSSVIILQLFLFSVSGPAENTFKQHISRYFCTSIQSSQGLHFLSTATAVSNDFVSEQQKLRANYIKLQFWLMFLIEYLIKKIMKWSLDERDKTKEIYQRKSQITFIVVQNALTLDIHPHPCPSPKHPNAKFIVNTFSIFIKLFNFIFSYGHVWKKNVICSAIPTSLPSPNHYRAKLSVNICSTIHAIQFEMHDHIK